MLDVFRFNHKLEEWEVVASFPEDQMTKAIAHARMLAEAAGLKNVHVTLYENASTAIMGGDWTLYGYRPTFGVAKGIDPDVRRV